jgi:hypothetical protein
MQTEQRDRKATHKGLKKKHTDYVSERAKMVLF